MQSLFNAADNDKIVERINKLTSSSVGQWGKMNVGQMLAHCIQPLLVAKGELQLKRGLMGFLFGKVAKKKFLENDFTKNLPTDKNFVITSEKDFETEKQKLLSLIDSFKTQGTSFIKNLNHSFFGKMTPDEWAVMMWRHLDHHLRQFGV